MGRSIANHRLKLRLFLNQLSCNVRVHSYHTGLTQMSLLFKKTKLTYCRMNMSCRQAVTTVSSVFLSTTCKVPEKFIPFHLVFLVSPPVHYPGKRKEIESHVTTLITIHIIHHGSTWLRHLPGAKQSYGYKFENRDYGRGPEQASRLHYTYKAY